MLPEFGFTDTQLKSLPDNDMLLSFGAQLRESMLDSVAMQRDSLSMDEKAKKVWVEMCGEHAHKWRREERCFSTKKCHHDAKFCVYECWGAVRSGKAQFEPQITTPIFLVVAW